MEGDERVTKAKDNEEKEKRREGRDTKRQKNGRRGKGKAVCLQLVKGE